MFIFEWIGQKIIMILIAAVLTLGVGNAVQWFYHGWKVKGLKQQVETLKTEKTELQSKIDQKEIEVKYAPKIEPLRKIAKRRTPKQIKPVVIERQPPPKVDPGEWADACAVAQSINDYWGVRDGGKKPLLGKTGDARIWPAPSRTHGQC